MSSPAFQFYPDNFLAGTDSMTQAEVGAYILLLCHQWNHGSTPVEPDRQQIISRGPVSDYVISKFKPCPDGKLRNERLEFERQKQAKYREHQRLKGIASAKSRKSLVQPRFNHGSTGASTVDQPEANSPSSSSSSLGVNKKEAEFPETPPMQHSDFLALAEMRGVSLECAEWFWNDWDSRNWLDKHGQPVRKVEPILLNFWKTWQSNRSRQAASSRVPAPPSLTEFDTPRWLRPLRLWIDENDINRQRKRPEIPFSELDLGKGKGVKPPNFEAILKQYGFRLELK